MAKFDRAGFITYINYQHLRNKPIRGANKFAHFRGPKNKLRHFK
jgi:hypothetical protein